jgi:hypothetical protein
MWNSEFFASFFPFRIPHSAFWLPGPEAGAEKPLDRIISLAIIPSVKLSPNRRLNPTLFLLEAKPEGVGERGLRT